MIRMTAMRLYPSAALLAITRPAEFADRLARKIELGRNERLQRPHLEPTHSDPIEAAHQVAGVAGCQECARILPDVRAAIMRRLPGGSHHDGGSALAGLLWVLVRHLRPECVVETGVARGISSAFTLDALDRNGSGHLWSIDLPEFDGQKGQTGVAVDPRLRSRWTYVRGASRRKMPGLLAKLGSIDLFTHDGMHTRECQLFEYQLAWRHVRDGGVLVSDDVNFSNAFESFAESMQRPPILLAEREKPSVVGLLHR
jgi:predicted O-methyltransferase YrrM